MRRSLRAFLAILVITQVGCAALERPMGTRGNPSWNKPWGRGAIVPATICTLVGAATGAYIQEIRTGETTARVSNEDGTTDVFKEEDDPEHWKGAIIGGAAGALLCGLVGHVFLDPREDLAPPPSPVGVAGGAAGAGVVSRAKIVLRGVNFDFDKAEIRPDSRPVLDEAASLLAERRADIEMLVVEGHTDAIGTDAYNQGLSMRRAEAVYRYLVNKGVPPEIMRTEGYGESKPVADNESESGRAQNRRVELRVISRSRPTAPPADAPEAAPEVPPAAPPEPQAE